jgi:hypothetical protein
MLSNHIISVSFVILFFHFIQHILLLLSFIFLYSFFSGKDTDNFRIGQSFLEKSKDILRDVTSDKYEEYNSPKDDAYPKVGLSQHIVFLASLASAGDA